MGSVQLVWGFAGVQARLWSSASLGHGFKRNKCCWVSGSEGG